MMQSLSRWFLQPFSRSPRKATVLTLLFVALVSVYGVYSMRKLETSYSMRQFMPADHPLYKNDNLIKNTFNLADEQPILITVELNDSEKGNWLEPSRMLALKQATETVAGMPGIQRATSLASLQFATDAPKGLLVGTLAETLPPEGWFKRIENNALLIPGLLSRNYRVATIVGDIPVIPSNPAKELVAQLRETLPKALPFAHVRVSGIIPIQLDTAGLLTSELGHFLLLAFILCVLTLFAYFRSFTTVAACLLLVVVSDIGALAYMALAGFPFSILSTSVPVLASITALVIGTHTLINYGNEWREDVLLHEKPNRIDRALKTYASLFLPNALMALTTAVGFATLTTSTVPLIRQYAWSIAGGILISWLLVSITLLPLMVLLPPPEVRKWTSLRTRWALWVVKRRWLVFSTIGLMALAMWMQGGKLNWSVMLFDDLPTQNGVKASADLLDHDLGGLIPLEMMITAPQKEQDPWTDPARIQKLGQLLASWRQDPSVGTAVGLPDFMQVGENFTKAKTNKAYAEIFFLYSLAGGNNALTQYLTTDGQSTRIAFRLKDIPSDRMESFLKRVQSDLHGAFPDLEVTSGGMVTMVHLLNEQISREMITGLWQSLLCISILVILIFRSVLWALAAAIPNLLSPLALLTTMSLLKTPIKPGVAIIFSIALGVAYNNTVYLLSRLKQLQERHGKGRTHLIEQTWYQEGNPCFFSTLTLLGGFSIFLSSFFLLNRIFGAYMLLSICAGMLGDLVFLPTLAKICPWLLASEGARKWLERTGLLKRRLDVGADRSA